MFRGFALLVCKLILGKVFGEYLCSTNSNSCPPHLPFCTAGRCVYQCASTSFIHGTDCVDNCGDWYINNSRCIEECPMLFNFIYEVPLSALTTARYCYAKCPLFTYADGLTCLERCPIERMFVENNTCVTNCSKSLKYRYPVLDRNKRIQVNGTKVCKDKCPDGDYFVPGTNELLIYGSRYVLNNTCVKSCGSLYESNGVCVERCPNSTKTIVSLEIKYNNLSRSLDDDSQFSSSPGKHSVCNGQCPSYGKIQNEECVGRCTSGYKVAFVNISTESYLSYADVCVSTCPKHQPYNYFGQCVSKCDEFDTLDVFINGTNCVLDCGKDWFISNNTCVEQCPHSRPYQNAEHCVSECDVFTNGTECVEDCGKDRFVFIETCVGQCPPNRSFIADVAKTYSIKLNRFYYFSKLIHFQECVEGCPNGSLIVDKKCVTKCPPGMSIFKNTCVFKCPEPFYFTMLGSVSHCVETCTSSYFIFNKTCYKKCPKELKVLNNTCVEECPETYKYTMTKVVNGEPFSCVSECPVDTFYKEDTCVDHCDMVYNATCVDVCPPVANLIQETELNHLNSYRKIKRCTRTCTEDTFKNGTKCVTDCGNRFVYNNTCVDVCPFRAILTLEMTKRNHNKVTVCLNACTQNTYKENTRCVAKCSEDMFVSNSSCVALCPRSQPYKHIVHKRKECLSKCPNNSFIDGDFCVKECKAHMFVAAPQICVEHCPNATPYIYELKAHYPNKPYNICVESCPDGFLANGSMCIKSYKCFKFQYDGKCLRSCPDGFLQSFHFNLSLVIFHSKIPHLTCVEACPDGQVANGSKCIQNNVYPHECNGFQYDGKCLLNCPDGFKQVSDKQIDEYHNLECVSLLSYKVVLSIASVALVVWGVSSCAFLSMREGFVNSLLWCRKEREFEIYTDNLDGAFGTRSPSDETDTRYLLDSIEISEMEDTSVDATQTSEETEIKIPIYDDCTQHADSELAQLQRNINP